MIARLINACVHNRGMVLLLTVFLVMAGVWSARSITVDAIPDLSDVQVVIRTEYPGQAPQIVEDQVTYPLTTAMLAVPYAKVVRGYSMFGSSFVYIIFEDGTDMYWARSRVLEQLSSVASRLPGNVSPQLGPDATGVGWVYEYVLLTGTYCPDHPQGVWHDTADDTWHIEPGPHREYHRIFRDRTTCPIDGQPLAQHNQDLSDLRGLQDWYLRFELTSVDGVSEVAALGGFVKQYQVVVDPVKLLAYNIPLQKMKMAIQRSNVDVGGRLIEMSETEYMVRGIGYLGSLTDDQIAAARAGGISLENARTDAALDELKKIALGANDDGMPIYLGDLADVRVGPEIRRGVADWNGEGEVAGGIVVMRFGENARATIDRVRAKLLDLEQGLPPGVAVRVAYDRSDLIDRAVHTVYKTLTEEVIVVSLVILLFLMHARSALVAAFVLPTGVLATLAVMYGFGVNANIMSLGGIAISIGVMVDSSIVMVENAHKHLERFREKFGKEPAVAERVSVIAEAAVEVGPTLFFSLLIITVSFLPIFVLGEQSGRMFRPLAVTKTLAMAAAAFLAVTIIPVLMVYLINERMLPSTWSRARRLAIYAVLIVGPASVIAFAPLPRLDAFRWWMIIGWVVGMGVILLPQRIHPEARNPLNTILQRIYHPFFVMAMRWWPLTVAVTIGGVVWVAMFFASLNPAMAARYPLLTALTPTLGSEFMPPLEEGDLLYMPTTDPGISVNKARELLQQTDKLIMAFPEVKTVLGKIGRAETATDPAPPSMLETTITLHRDKSLWRTKPVARFYDDWPNWLAWLPRQVWPETRTITLDELIYGYEWPDGTHVPGLNETVQMPGLTNSWTMPIKTRIDMLSTGIKTPVGIKIMGPDLDTLSELASEVASVVKTADGTGAYTVSAFAEKSVGGNYFDIRIDRDAIARYGLLIGDVQDVIMTAMGGMNVTQTVEGLERYPVNIRYPHELRDTPGSLRQVLVSTPSGAQVPLGQLATIEIHKGPPMIKSENARLTSWVFVDIAGIDVGTYVTNAQRAVAAQVALPAGYSIVWSGQYEYMQAARARLLMVVPLAAMVILLLLYMATRSWLRVAIIVSAFPFSIIGAILFLWMLDYNLSLAVWVGVIALIGLDAETSLVMLLYLDNSFERFEADGRMKSPTDLWFAVHDGAVQRIRPKTMTVVTTFIALVPLMWASGAGADTMRRLAAPMIGGLITSFILELLIYPVLFYLAKSVSERKHFSTR